MNRLTQVIGITIALLLGMLALPTTVLAEAELNAKTNALHDQIGSTLWALTRDKRMVGLWDVQVSVVNCVTGAPLASFIALHKFELGGTGQVVPASNPAALSAHMMIWSHISGRDYVESAKFFRFDGAGTLLGWTVLTNEISINKAADKFEGSGIAEVFNTAGDLVGTSCPNLVGTRFTGE